MIVAMTGGVRIEQDFTGDPERQLARLCEFVGEPFSPGALTGLVGSQRISTGDPLLFGAVVRSRADWRQDVPADAAARIERECGAALSALGYERYTS